MTAQTDGERWSDRERRWSEIGDRAAKAEESEGNAVNIVHVIEGRMDV
jgi:hypothetical protein